MYTICVIVPTGSGFGSPYCLSGSRLDLSRVDLMDGLRYSKRTLSHIHGGSQNIFFLGGGGGIQTNLYV